MFSNLHPSLRNAFYVIILVFCGLFAATYYTFKVIYSNGPIEVVDKNYYQIGLNYEKQIETKKKMLEEGYKFELNAQGWKQGDNSISISFKKGEELLSGKQIELVLERAATEAFTRKYQLQEKEKGVYSESISIQGSGRWFLTLRSKENGSDFDQTFTVEVN